ncbi:MAG: helix-turn-helix transcriptional regulator [Cellulosilyticum sp.]|nr:helix-turn-helix transcriptional regulator [Cellulosilyticum sp.]
MEIVDRIKILCAMKKISIGDLESALGFSKGSIYKWDKSSPGFDKVIKVANYFQVSLDYMAGYEDENPNQISHFAARQGNANKSTFSQEDLDMVTKSIASYLSKMSINELTK